MPELPDVEGFRRTFARFAAGRRVEAVLVPDPELVRNTSPQGLGRALRGRRLGDPERHGKWLLVPVGRATVLLHFGMTGLVRWTSRPDARLHRHDRVVFRCEGGELRYRNMRRFGGVWLARSPAERERVTGPLGPDALTVEREAFVARLFARRGAAKPALMDQRLVAGLGNLLADEILWRARVHPRTPVAALGERGLADLHDTMRRVLVESARRGRVPPEPGWLTGARDRPGASCPRCGTALGKATIGGRTACWCPRCQPAG